MSDYIPDDLLADVLLRLPLESLLRSRCVSKSWCALIDCPHFIKLHSNKRSLKLNYDDDLKVVSLSHAKFYTLEFDNPVDSSIATAKQLNFPLKHPESENRLVGSCNGLICLTTPDSDIVFWNPWTQKYWDLPSPPIEYSIGSQVSFRLGVGYEQNNDDYKVLNFVTFSDIFEESSSSQGEVYVYSSKQNSWKRLIGDIPFMFPQYQPDVGALANGALHWIVKAKEWDVANSIVAFDLRSEEFRVMPCPRNPNHTFEQNLRILNGSLCLLSYYYSSGRYRVDLWVMEDYGAGDESWNKLTSIKMPYGNWSFWHITPVSYLKNRRKVVLQIEGEKLVVYDLLTRSMEDVSTSSSAVVTSLDACVCLGSLIQPNIAGENGTD